MRKLALLSVGTEAAVGKVFAQRALQLGAAFLRGGHVVQGPEDGGVGLVGFSVGV